MGSMETTRSKIERRSGKDRRKKINLNRLFYHGTLVFIISEFLYSLIEVAKKPAFYQQDLTKIPLFTRFPCFPSSARKGQGTVTTSESSLYIDYNTISFSSSQNHFIFHFPMPRLPASG